MPVNSFGDFETNMFHVAVSVSDRPLANMARFVDTSISVECNINNPNASDKLIIPPYNGRSYVLYFIYDKWSNTCEDQEHYHKR
jgi:hypothetical protein